MRGKLSRKQAASDIEMQDFLQLFCLWKTAIYCLDPEPEPEPELEPEPEPKLLQSRTRNHNRSLRFHNTVKSAAINKSRTYDSLQR